MKLEEYPFNIYIIDIHTYTARYFFFLGLSSMSFLTKLLFAVPSHWLILYDSNEMGLAANRFLHHVLAYKGPTLILIKANDDSLFCVASPCEWKESHLYWGGEDCAVVQLLPK